MDPSRHPSNLKLRSTVLLAALLAAALASCNKTDLRDGPTLGNLQGGPPVLPGPGPCDDPPSQSDLMVVINELMFINDAAFPDENGNFVPWIELYNPTQQVFHLGGVELSRTDLFFSFSEVWTFPCVPAAELGPGEFLVVFLDGDTANPDDLHASWQPDPTMGQWIFLNQGSSSVFTNAGDHVPDLSRGRIPDGGSGAPVLLMQPSPGGPNSGPFFPPQLPFLRGDANGDGIVDGLDPEALLAFISGMQPMPTCPDRLDVNDNGVVNLIDVTFLVSALQMGGPPIAPPVGTPGLDPTTSDRLDCF